MKTKQAGVAIILVIFIVALASILVVNLTYSTFLSTRTVGMVERQLQAEYILKSLVNFSQSLVQFDTSRHDSFQDDVWGYFSLNPRIPNEFLGISDLNSEIYLEIVPRNSKFNLSYLSNINSNPRRAKKDPYMAAVENLLLNLKCDEELLEEEQYGPFKGREFKSAEIVANLVDWQDHNIDSFDDPFFQGIEGEVDKETVFNEPFGIIGQLSMVPGITPRRLNALSPFIATFSKDEGMLPAININTAGNMVLKSLHSGLTETVVEDIKAYITENGAFETKSQISSSGIVPQDVINDVSTYLTVSTRSFDVYGKVKYGLQRAYYLKARLARGRGQAPPKIISAVYY